MRTSNRIFFVYVVVEFTIKKCYTYNKLKNAYGILEEMLAAK